MTTEALLVADQIRKIRPQCNPKMAIVLGSGLGGLTAYLEETVSFPYEELPGFVKPRVDGHSGQLILGFLEGVEVICLQGRAHLYEGISPNVIRTMVRTCRLLGCETWLATNASGSLHSEISPGSLAVIRDHINLQMINPLLGANDAEFGPRFIGLDDAYDVDLRQKLQAIAKQQQIILKEGVYVAVLGPSFETPAEIKAFRILGADFVGMSTVSEVIVARHCGMRVLVVSVITNLAAGLHPTQLSHDDTLRGAALGIEDLTRLLRAFVKESL